MTAREGTDLPFDVHDVPTLPWDVQKMEELEARLHDRIGKIAARLGRRPR